MVDIQKRRESPYVLRVATEEDTEGCVELALQIPTENTTSGMFPPPSIDKVRGMVSSLIQGSTLLVYENNGVLVGIIGVVIDSFWWSDKQYIMDVIFYVKPEFRSHNTFKRMLSAVEAFGKINHLPVALLFFTTVDVKRKFKLLSRRGYKPAGFWVIKE